MLRDGHLSLATAALCLILIFLLPPGGPARAQDGDPVAMMGRITDLARLGKFDEAIQIGKRLIPIIEKMAGKRHPLYAGQIAGLGDLHTLKGDNPEAKRLHTQALKLREDLLGREHADVASSLASLATVNINLALYDEAEAQLKRTLAIRKKVLPASDPNYGFTFVNLGRLQMMRSSLFEAETAFQQALDLFRKHLPADHMFLPVTMNNLAEAKRALGRLPEAEALLREALASAEKIYGADGMQVTPMINNLAQLYRQLGRYGQAEALMRRELAITERAVGADHRSIAVSLNNLGTLLAQRGRPQDAETLLRRSLAIEEGQSGADHPQVATTLNNLADAVSRQGRADDAEALFRRSLAIRETLHGADHPVLAVSLDNLASHLLYSDRLAEAEAMARRALAIRMKHMPADHPDIGLSLSNLGTLLDRQGKPAEARPLHERAVALREAALGSQHPEVAQSLNNLGGNRLDERDWAEAYASYKRGADIWIGRRLSPNAEPAATDDSELKRFADPFLGLIWAAYEIGQGAAPERREALSEEAFAALQWGSLSNAADAIAQLSARIAAGSGALSGLVRERQDLADSITALDKALIAAIAAAPELRSPGAETELRDKALAQATRLKALDAELAARFSEFAGLARPQPVSIAQLRRTLRADEALYTGTFTRSGGFAWVITRGAERWFRLPRTHQEMEDDVTALRCGVDVAAWDAPDSRCGALAPGRYTAADRKAGRPPRFDLDRAHAVYKALFEPAEDLIAGRHLVIMPTAALTRLPFHLLVTEKPAAEANGTEAYRHAAWLARRTPITILPTLGAIEILRGRLERRTDATEPYFGMGNPLLDGPDGRYTSLARAAREQQSCATAQSGDAWIASRGLRAVAPSIITPGGLADPGFLRKQPPLPETAFELCKVASQLGSRDGPVMLGRDASEATLKTLNGRGALSKYRVLHFATHGAMAGEVVGSAEPGLLLTPPDIATADEDGYLSASEIALLKLDADLVILSACNTAAGGRGTADETLSGLARSFFYAGARALFVSHWAVDSVATVRLITTALAAKTGDPSVGHAEALRRAMVELIDKGNAGEVHPAAWAPFVVVGGTG
jgi:CHAT domain-containing protein/Tfp pilus assembly protein PilF